MKVVILFFLFLCNVSDASDTLSKIYGPAYQKDKNQAATPNKPTHPARLNDQETIEWLLSLPTVDSITKKMLLKSSLNLKSYPRIVLNSSKRTKLPGPIDTDCAYSESDPDSID